MSASSLRIAIDVRASGPGYGGIGRYVQELTHSLVRAAPENNYLLLRSPSRGEPHQTPDGGAVDVRQTHAPTSNWMMHGWEEMMLPSHLKRWRADVFHSPLGLIPTKQLPVRRVITVHDLTVFDFPQYHRRRAAFIMRARAAKSIKTADLILAVSQSTRADLLRRFNLSPARVVVTHLGVEARFNPHGGGEGTERLYSQGLRRPYILSVGTLEPRKNQLRLLTAFEKVASHFPEHQLVLAGRPGWYHREIMTRMATTPLGDRVHLLQYVHDEDLPQLYRTADVMVYPSLYEGFGLPPLEAMASGTPVITSAVSSMPEIVGDAAILIDPTSTDAIAAAIERVLSDGVLRQRMCTLGLARAREFTWAISARRTLEAYQRVVGCVDSS